uniref:UBC core domain-containing protein n=1 Tax=viral metagenome TaxID=1070528 RepID=A0A6C0JC71_9ZZZZ
MNIFINKRLINEYKQILESPIENIETHPTEDNILKWYYLLKPNSGDYQNGQYLGTLEFPEEYPMKPPKITMITPNGRFETNTRLCLSISDFHPETWNPSWNVETILIGLISFMLSEEYTEGTIGSIKDTSENRRKYAIESIQFNKENIIFKELFIESGKILYPKSERLGKRSEKTKMCRFCFNKGDELISPCKCTGTNKWVHPKCLAKWQYTSILSQSTHPKYQTGIEYKCNVCLSPYNIKKFTREDLMLEFTGKEIANMIRSGYYIVSGEESSKHNETIIKKHIDNKEVGENLKHWTHGVFLITNVIHQSTDINQDGIHGVNLTRKIMLEEGYTKHYTIWQNYGHFITFLPPLDINHFIGGPCEPFIPFSICKIKKNIIDNNELQRINVTVINNLVENESEHIFIFGNTHIIFEVLKQVPHCNVFDNNKIHINVFWGLAGWSRTQLLGEIAKGGWGLMRGKQEEVLPWKKNIWQNVIEKKQPIFAGKNDFSSKYD